jgi:hypothetical protein
MSNEMCLVADERTAYEMAVAEYDIREQAPAIPGRLHLIQRSYALAERGYLEALANSRSDRMLEAITNISDLQRDPETQYLLNMFTQNLQNDSLEAAREIRALTAMHPADIYSLQPEHETTRVAWEIAHAAHLTAPGGQGTLRTISPVDAGYIRAVHELFGTTMTRGQIAGDFPAEPLIIDTPTSLGLTVREEYLQARRGSYTLNTIVMGLPPGVRLFGNRPDRICISLIRASVTQ